MVYHGWLKSIGISSTYYLQDSNKSHTDLFTSDISHILIIWCTFHFTSLYIDYSLHQEFNLRFYQLVTIAMNAQSNSAFSFNSQFQQDGWFSSPLFIIIVLTPPRPSLSKPRSGFKGLIWKFNPNKVKRMRESVHREIRPSICSVLMCLCINTSIEKAYLCVRSPLDKPFTHSHAFFLECFFLCLRAFGL